MLKNPAHRHFARLLSWLYDKPAPLLTTEQRELAKALKSRFQQISQSNSNHNKSTWGAMVNELHTMVATSDLAKFLRWKVIQLTMFATNNSYVKHELKHLQDNPEWETRWRQALEESSIGHPLPYYRYPKSSGNLIHHAYHICRLERMAGIPIQKMEFIFEFGGGYGSLCRLIHALGFRGTYVIFDFPELSALQTFYLESHGIPVNITHKNRGTIHCLSSPQDISKCFKSDLANNSYSLFLATWSLSETPLDFRKEFLSLLPIFDFMFIAYQYRFSDIDNMRFFQQWRENTVADYEWDDFPLSQLPQNSYLFGKKRSEDRLHCEAN